MKLSELKKLINEEVKTLLEYEYYVDERGYAHDDEGNTWYVGGGKGTYSLRTMPKHHRPGFGRKRPRQAFPYGTTNELIKAMEEAIESAKGEKTKDFLMSLLSQYRKKGGLTDKQRAALTKIFKQLGLDNHVEYIEMQGKSIG